MLRLKKFEDELDKIREHYRKLNAHVRKFAAGEFAQQSQELLNELAKAMLCLTDSLAKRDYDASLGRAKTAATTGGRSMEELLLATQGGRRRSTGQGPAVSPRPSASICATRLMQQKLVKPDVVMPAYAESIGLPFLDLNDSSTSTCRSYAGVPAVIARTHSCMPVLMDDNQLLMASPNPIDPHVEEELRLRFGMPVRTVLCLPASLNELVNKHYSRETLAAEKPAAGVPQASAPALADPAIAAAQSGGAVPAPETPQQKKQRNMIALMSFNFSFVAYQVALAMLGRSGWGLFFLGFPLAVIVGGTVWAVVRPGAKVSGGAGASRAGKRSGAGAQKGPRRTGAAPVTSAGTFYSTRPTARLRSASWCSECCAG